mmetsp:Transcript_9028/g.28783  ORF Transcript_9028/g.28783 Transcript_9028/m.28783 type:complete len:309 (-) Transcript_9028:15-941(-)
MSDFPIVPPRKPPNLFTPTNLPDNFVDVSFLRVPLVRTTPFLSAADRPRLTQAAAVIVAVTGGIACLASITLGLLTGSLTLPSVILGTSSGDAAALSAALLWIGVGSALDIWLGAWGSLRTRLVMLPWVALVAPLASRLTAAFADNTVVACTSSLVALHLLTYPYPAELEGGATQGPVPTMDSGRSDFAVSLNAGIAASVLTVSRLSSTLQAFAILAMAVEWFGFSPTQRMALRRWSKRSHALAAWTMGLAGTFLLGALITSTVAFLFLALHAFIVFVGPVLLLNAQQYKSNFSGPWTEARPSIAVNN